MDLINAYTDNHFCSNCIHFEINKKQTLESERQRIGSDEQKEIKFLTGKCIKRNSPEIKIEVNKRYKDTFVCYENELKL